MSAVFINYYKLHFTITFYRKVFYNLISLTFYFTLLFSHLADAFIQSDLQIRTIN